MPPSQVSLAPPAAARPLDTARSALCEQPDNQVEDVRLHSRKRDRHTSSISPRATAGSTVQKLAHKLLM